MTADLRMAYAHARFDYLNLGARSQWVGRGKHQRWIISTTKRAISIKLAITVGPFLRDLDFENMYMAWLSCCCRFSVGVVFACWWNVRLSWVLFTQNNKKAWTPQQSNMFRFVINQSQVRSRSFNFSECLLTVIFEVRSLYDLIFQDDCMILGIGISHFESLQTHACCADSRWSCCSPNNHSVRGW